jgi:hypothetical protein
MVGLEGDRCLEDRRRVRRCVWYLGGSGARLGHDLETVATDTGCLVSEATRVASVVSGGEGYAERGT